ncbi:alpha/beta fold hydrolase [Homoserinimonas sp. A520]
MVTFALIHGGGSSAWDWHFVAALLEEAGHEAVAVDLPIEDDGARLEDYAQAVVDAVGTRRDVIVVGHSLGGFTAPLAAEALGAIGLVYLAGMIPLPGETFDQWWTNTGHDRETIDEDPDVSFFNGVPDALAREARTHERDQQGSWMSRPWPGVADPVIPTKAILCRDDAFFPAEFMRRQVRERLGIDPEEIAGGHYAALSNPTGVADSLLAFAEHTLTT